MTCNTDYRHPCRVTTVPQQCSNADVKTMKNIKKSKNQKRSKNEKQENEEKNSGFKILKKIENSAQSPSPRPGSGENQRHEKMPNCAKCGLKNNVYCSCRDNTRWDDPCVDGVHVSFGLDTDGFRGDVSHRDSWVRASQTIQQPWRCIPHVSQVTRLSDTRRNLSGTTLPCNRP